MGTFFRNKLNIVLWIAAFVMAVFLVVYLVAVARFLIGAGTVAFGGSLLKNGEIVTFNLAKVAQLKQLRGVR